MFVDILLLSSVLGLYGSLGNQIPVTNTIVTSRLPYQQNEVVNDNPVWLQGVVTYDLHIDCGDIASYFDYADYPLTYEEQIADFTLNDTNADILYHNFVSVDFSLEFERTQQNAFKFKECNIHVNKYDYDTPYGSYPVLNYIVYTSALFHDGLYDEDYMIGGDNIVSLWTDYNESIMVFDEYGFEMLNNDSYIDIFINFQFLDNFTFDCINRGMLSQADTDFNSAYQAGYQAGKEAIVTSGEIQHLRDISYSIGVEDGIQQGIALGREQVIEQGQTASIIFNGIISVGLLPTNVFLKMLNLEVFGINIGALVSSLLTVMVLIIVIRMIFGGKSGVDKRN